LRKRGKISYFAMCMYHNNTNTSDTCSGKWPNPIEPSMPKPLLNVKIWLVWLFKN